MINCPTNPGSRAKLTTGQEKLGEVCEKLNLQKAPIGSWPYVEIGDIDIENKSIIFKDKKSIRGAIIAPADSVLVSRVRPTRGAIVYIDKDYVVSSAFSILKPKLSESFSKFLFYWLGFSKNFFQYLQKKQKGSNYPSVRDKDILNFKIHIPSLKIQQKIVERLDAIKKAQELNDKQITLTDELFQSLLHQELKPKGKNWEVKKLGELIETQYGYTASAKDKGNYRFVRITDIDDDGNLKQNDKKYVSLSLKEIKDYVLDKEDLLLARIGSIGKILYFCDDEPSIFASYLICLSPDKSKIIPQYLWLFSRTPDYWRQVKLFAAGAVQPQFNANRIKQIKISLPPIEIQRKIVEKLSAVQEYKKKLVEQREKLKELFESVLHKSMAGKI